MSGGRNVLYDLGEHLAENFLGEGLCKLFAGHLEALGLSAVAISFIIPVAAYFHCASDLASARAGTGRCLGSPD